MAIDPKKPINQSKKHDAETQSMLYEGATVSQLATLFAMDNRNVTRKIYGKVEPVKMRGGVPIYLIKEAAPYLTKPAMTPEEYIQIMHYSDLPPVLRKEYWSAMRSRQLYEIEAGDLWHTERIQEHLTDIFKAVNMSVRQFADLVERQATLSDKQRDIIIQLSDDLLINTEQQIRDVIEQARKKEQPDGTNDKTSNEDDEDEL